MRLTCFLGPRRLSAVVPLITLAAAAEARAESPSVPHPAAYGVFVGSNAGGPGQQPLRYAEDDARRVADVLRDLGRFGATDLRVLGHPDAARVLATLDELAPKLREHQQRGEQAVFVFYYSGHAKAGSLSLGEGELPLSALRERLQRLPATLSLVVLDACQSGSFARTKGAEPAADFSLNSVSRLTQRGTAILASSTAQEISQESDSLRSSFFTHHLVTALRGAGDTDGDGRVSLDEAYRYAYRRALAATSKTRVGGQHATLDTDLSGQGDVAVTYPVDGRSKLELPRALDAKVLVQKKPSGGALAEVVKVSGAPVVLALPVGTYEATVRTAGRVFVCPLALTEGRTTSIDLGACTAASEAGAVKGEDDDADVPPPPRPSSGSSALADAPEAPPVPPPMTKREIDRWAIEGTAGVVDGVSDAYVERLKDFGYSPRGSLSGERLSLGASRELIPHVSALLTGFTLARGELRRGAAGLDDDTLSFRGYGTGVFLRVHADLFPFLGVYGQAGAGFSFATSTLSFSDTHGRHDSSDTSWGLLLGAGAGLVLFPRGRLGVLAQAAFDRAPALSNLLGERHDVGGFSGAIGLRVRFGEVGR